jgi:hypothetical protein
MPLAMSVTVPRRPIGWGPARLRAGGRHIGIAPDLGARRDDLGAHFVVDHAWVGGSNSRGCIGQALPSMLPRVRGRVAAREGALDPGP